MTSQVCVRCGQVRAEHYGVNWSDQSLIAATVLVCPTAVYLEGPDEAELQAPIPHPEPAPHRGPTHYTQKGTSHAHLSR